MYYIKAFTTDANGHLSSPHGGSMTWRLRPDYLSTPDEPAGVDWVEIPKEERSTDLCRHGVLHGLRLRDWPAWISTHAAIVEVDGEVFEGPDKVGFHRCRIVRVLVPDIPALDLLVGFAKRAAELARKVADGDNVDVTEGLVDYLVSHHPDGSFEEVER